MRKTAVALFSVAALAVSSLPAWAISIVQCQGDTLSEGQSCEFGPLTPGVSPGDEVDFNIIVAPATTGYLYITGDAGFSVFDINATGPVDLSYSFTTDGGEAFSVTGEYAIALILESDAPVPGYLSAFQSSPNANIPLVNATPLPATLPLLAGGLGLVGFLARRRKRNASAAITA